MNYSAPPPAPTGKAVVKGFSTGAEWSDMLLVQHEMMILTISPLFQKQILEITNELEEIVTNGTTFPR